MNNRNIQILLATYNGAKYLVEQIESILSQTHTSWTLKVRDDGSTDSTLDIINYYIGKDDRISLLEDNDGNLKSSQNFSKLMESCEEDVDFVMFCDQDDIWMPSKIELSLKTILKLEDKYGSESSLLTYGTYKLMDEYGNLIPKKIPNYSNTPSLNILLNQNYLYGCTIMINKLLLKQSSPIPTIAENHDYWIALTAVVNHSKIAYIEQPLLYYRQHSCNVSGSYKDANLSNRLRRLSTISEIELLRDRGKMANVLLIKNLKTINNSNKLLITKFISKLDLGGLNLFIFCFKNRFHRIKLSSTGAFYFNLLRSIKK